MTNILSDDIGSYPLPKGVDRTWANETGLKIASGESSAEEKEKFYKIVAEIMSQKIKSGISNPNYPQVRDMISSFFGLMEKFQSDEPWVVPKENAVIPEIDAIQEVAKRHHEETKTRLNLRVCVTGPLDLYIANAGTTIDGELLKNLGKSVSGFIENSIVDTDYMKTTLISIDEPSLGLNPNLVFESGDLIEAWNLATKPAKDLDVQIHLHSSAEAEIVYQTDDIAIIGVESAENPENLSGFDKKELEENDRFLRVGVSRTNINGITSDWMEKTGTNVWSEKEKMLEMIDGMESPEIIGKRLEKAYELFGDRIKYAGPDCGMGLWPSQDTARKLLANTARAINTFNNK